MCQAHFTRDSDYYFVELWLVSFWVQDGGREVAYALCLFLRWRWDKAEGLVCPRLRHDGLECRGGGIEVVDFDFGCQGVR